jgi:hypothetical protein
MKNVRENQFKKCIFLDIDEFSEIIKGIFGRNTIVEYTLEGLSIYNEIDCLPNSEICEALANYFDVFEVTSFHADDCDYIGVWVVYKEGVSE